MPFSLLLTLGCVCGQRHEQGPLCCTVQFTASSLIDLSIFHFLRIYAAKSCKHLQSVYVLCCSLRGEHYPHYCRGHREPHCACAQCCYLHSSEPAGVVCHRVLCCCLSAAVGATCRDGFDIRVKYFRTLVSLYFCNYSCNVTRYQYIPMLKSNIWYLFFGRFISDAGTVHHPLIAHTHNQTVTIFGSFDPNERFAISYNKQSHPNR